MSVTQNSASTSATESTPGATRNRRQYEFHQTFKSIPEDESLLDSYACALNKEILIQGRMYVGEEHICFYANILGWITNVVIAYRDVVSIEKRNTAIVFPNAIQIATLHHRYFFASFVYREEAHRQLLMAWKRAMLEKQPFDNTSHKHRDYSKYEEEMDIFADDILKITMDSTPTGNRGNSMNCTSGSENEIRCGCEIHFSTEGLSIIVNMPISTLHSTLLDSRNTFLQRFFESFSMKNCWIEEWNSVLSGGEQRVLKMKMPLPRILSDSGCAIIQATEKYLLNQPTRRFVTETVTEILDIPGGVCRVLTRMCLTFVDADRSHLYISFDAFPPRGSFFKESVRRSLTTHFAELYTALGVAITDYCSTKNEESVPRRSLSWFRRRKSDRFSSLRRDSSSSYQSYFDMSAFFRSLAWILACVILFSAYIFGRVIVLNRTALYDELESRQQMIENLGNQLRIYLARKNVLDGYEEKQDPKLENLSLERKH